VSDGVAVRRSLADERRIERLSSSTASHFLQVEGGSAHGQCGSTLSYYLTHLAAGYVAAIGFRARNNASVAVDDRKRHGIVSTLEVQRLIIGAVNMNDLARTQANPNLLRSTVVVAVTRHDVDVAVAINWPVEGDDVFIANRRHNGLIRPNRA
jgi:hypothetical protein